MNFWVLAQEATVQGLSAGPEVKGKYQDSHVLADAKSSGAILTGALFLLSSCYSGPFVPTVQCTEVDGRF